jgi:hypothetical protein
MESNMESKQVPASEVGSTPVLRLMAEANARDAFLTSLPSTPSRYAPGLSPSSERAITLSGFWSGVGFVGASVLAAGLVVLGNGGMHIQSVLLALALVVAGGTVATFAWRNAWSALDRIDTPVTESEPAPAANAETIARGVAAGHPQTVLASH